jgi:CHAT domain-containing protein
MEQAIASFTEALEVRTSNREIIPERWAETQNNLGEAYRQRIKGEREQNIEQAIAFYNNALEVFIQDDFPEQWATTLNNLAITYLLRIREEPADNIELGITSFTAALKVFTRDAFPQSHAETLFNLGLAYREVPNLQQAHDTFANAIDTVEFLRREIHSGDETKQKLAEEYNGIYRNMVEVCIELKNYTAAIEYAERSKARNLVELLASRDLYPKGDIPETVINELSRLRREIDTEQRRLDIKQTNRNSNGGTISGERSPKIDNLETTIRDQSHLTQLRRQLDELIDREIKPKDPDFALTQEVKGISYSEIQALTAKNSTILQWYITNEKFLAFIITPESSTPIVWQSSKADFTALEKWLKEYLTEYGKNKTQWQENLASRLQNLAEILHLDEILKNVPQECSQLILIPHSVLHRLPLHALPVSGETWQRFNSKTRSPEPTNPCLLDCFKQGVRYAPSCQILQQAQSRKRPHFTHLFAIANPTNANPTDDRYLLELQAANICDRFKPNDFLLKKDDANKKAIQSQQLSLANCAHFGCHGKFEPDSPLESALQLANNERLTLLEILNLDLNQCRLVTLSACETGLTESKTSDEYIGLPFGFLLAGSPSMVSTLWEVDELACTLLLMRFYQNLETLSTVNALNEAQQWLRNLTSEGLEEVLELLKPQIDQVFEQLPRKERTRFVKAPLDAALNRKPFPFAEPHYWAGFTAIGV